MPISLAAPLPHDARSFAHASRVWLRALVLALPLALAAGSAGAQVQGGSLRPAPLAVEPCSYDRCALRVEDGWFARRVIRGTTGETAARLGWGGPSLASIVGRSDSALVHAEQYRRSQRTGTALSLLGSAATIVTYVALWDKTDADSDRNGLIAVNVGGVVTTYIGTTFLKKARRELDRAIWWYNRDVAVGQE